jgi:hypothetical protein
MSTVAAITRAIAVLVECRDRIQSMQAPVVQDDLVQAVQLSREIVRIQHPEAR